MKPSIGRIVHLRVADSFDDIEAINALGGNRVIEGDIVAAIITAVHSDTCVNLKALVDGPADYWASSRELGDDPGQWNWPPRV